MDDLIKEFLVESNENLDRLDSELVKLESDPSSQDLLSSIFRTIHTIKGSCGFLGFSKLEKVAHVGESLLSRLRDGKLSLTPEFTSGLLAMVDAIRIMLGEIQTTGQDGNEDYPDLIESLNRLQQQSTDVLPKSAPDPSPKEPSKKQQSAAVKENPAKSAPPASKAEPEKAASPPAPDPSKAQVAPEANLRPVAGKIGGLLVERGSLRPEDLAVALKEQLSGDTRRLGEILVSLGYVTAEDTQAAQQIQEGSRTKNAAAETIRVDVH